jgi:hypothetical protein
MHGSTAEPEVVQESTDEHDQNPSSNIIPVQDAEQPEPGITLPDIVEVALALDMNITNRRKRNSDAIIPIHDRNQLSTQERALVALTAKQMLWDKANKRQRITIAEAACKYNCYYLGYKAVHGTTMVASWIQKFDNIAFADPSSIFQSNHKGSMSPLRELEARRPQYVLQLFRLAVDVTGPQASFEELATTMTDLAENDEHFTFQKDVLRQWFKARGGKLRSGRLAKPVLTEDHMRRRLEWAQEMLQRVNDIVVHIDEKWFYSSSQRNKYKDMGDQLGEVAGSGSLSVRRTVSRNNPSKVMFMGAVGRPDDEHGFDGKVDIIRVSQLKRVRVRSYRQRFSFD